MLNEDKVFCPKKINSSLIFACLAFVSNLLPFFFFFIDLPSIIAGYRGVYSGGSGSEEIFKFVFFTPIIITIGLSLIAILLGYSNNVINKKTVYFLAIFSIFLSLGGPIILVLLGSAQG